MSWHRELPHGLITNLKAVLTAWHADGNHVLIKEDIRRFFPVMLPEGYRVMESLLKGASA